MKRILTAFCFSPESLDGEKIVELINKSVKFVPTAIQTNDFLKDGGKFDEARHLKRIATSNNMQDLNLETDMGLDGPIFEVTFLPNWSVQVVYWTVSYKQTPDQEFLNELTSLPGFTAGYSVSNEDFQWQSEEIVTNYEISGKSHEQLPKIYDEDFQEEKVDISRNPGRGSLFPGMWLLSCWRMWFGQGVFKYIPKERILAFPNALKIEELPSGSAFIELYPDPFACELKENREIQRAFREWVGMDELEKQADEIASGLIDPMFNMDEGKFPHGGVRLITVWVDKNGKPISRSKASKKFISELDEKGKAIWKEESSV